jgi:hypothetical protein
LETSDNSIDTSSLNDKYSSIALLDDELEEEKWEERTTVITKTDHENYVAAATSILQEVLLDVKTPINGNNAETPPEDDATNISSQTGFASANTSLVSTYRTMDSDSETEYESAAENETSYSVDASNNPADDSEIEFGNKLLDAIDITDNSVDIETALEGLKLQVGDREKTPRAEETNIIDTHEEKNIIHEEREKNTPVKLKTEIEHQPALVEVSENVATLENINEVVHEASALDIIDTNCQADQNDDIEEEKDATQSITADPIRPNDISIENESEQNTISSQSTGDNNFETPPEETEEIAKFEVSEESDKLDNLDNILADETISVEKENAVHLETNPSEGTDNLGSDSAQVSDNIAAETQVENSENEIPVAKDQSDIDILSVESEDLPLPISSSEKAELAELVPKSEQDENVSDTFESLPIDEEPPIISNLQADVDPMDDLLSGFEKIKIAATPKPAESSKLFDYNINTGEIEEVKQIPDPIVEQKLKIDFVTALNEEPDSASLMNVKEIKNDSDIEENVNERENPSNTKLH